MRRFFVIVAISAVGCTGATALLASPAAAAVPTASLCSQLKNLHYTPSSDPTAVGGRSNAKKLAKAFNNLAKKAKGDLQAALKTMAQYFTDVANLNTTAIQNDAQPLASDVTRFTNYITQSCVAGLPGGVKIPTIPTIPAT